jgi:hypothetical protein
MDVDREHIDLNAANNYLNSENSDFFGSQSESSSVVTNQNDLPFFFADRRTPVILEPIFLPLLLILAAILLGFCLILPGIRGRQRVFAALRFFMLGSAGLWIFFSFFCTEWISASTKSQVQFYSHEREFVESDIKLQLGFFSANITLEATDDSAFPNRKWNERFQMHQIDDDYNVLLKNGVPSPILEIASHFTSRSSRVSMQRSKKFVLFFRISFAFQALSLILWLVSVCIISKTIAVGAQFLLLSGLSQIMSCTLIAFIPEMIIHLPGSKLETGFGWCWSLNLGMGIYAFALAVIIQMMDCFATTKIEEFFNFVPFQENDCFECKQLGFTCDHCNKAKPVTPVPRTRYESETVKAVRQMVNGGKLYPKAISMKLEDELKYDNRSSRSSKSTKSSRSSRKSPKIVQGPGQTFGLDSAFETASTVSSKVTDNTLEYGDWQIMEPGNFGTERHFLDGFVSPTVLPALQNGARPAMFRRESSYSSTCDEA